MVDEIIVFFSKNIQKLISNLNQNSDDFENNIVNN